MAESVIDNVEVDEHPGELTEYSETTRGPRKSSSITTKDTELEDRDNPKHRNPFHTLSDVLTGLEDGGFGETISTEENQEATANGGAEASEPEYMLVDNEDILKTSIKLLQEAVKEEPVIAVDSEGDLLSRKGKLHLIAVATRKKAFLVDVLTLQSKPFDLGLRAILEDKTIKKLMFDCRGDSDALFHQFNVKLDAVLDIQILEVIKRSTEPQGIHLERRSERHDEVVRLRGQLWCIENLLTDKEMLKQKKKGASFMSDWGKRPLQEEQVEYAKTDVLSLFKLYDKLNPDEEEIRRLEIASGVYVDLKRSIVVRNYGQYEDHGYLPMDVIPDKGRTGFDYCYICCIACKRMFPVDEFSKTQLRKNIQRCRTCKRVKQDDDVRTNRQRNSEYESVNYYDYDSFGSNYGNDSIDYEYDSSTNDSDYC